MRARIRGADVLVRAMALAGVERIFALSGNHVMSVFDAVLDQRIEIVHCRHEAAAVFMADAWGRLTGQPGVALVTGGPGHANAVAPLFTARESESPVVMLAGHAPLGEIGLGAFQEMRQAEMAVPVTKAAWTSQSIGTLAEDFARAFRLAASGRPGPVHISLPTDLLEGTTATSNVVIPERSDFSGPVKELSSDVANAVNAALGAAARPIIIGGPTLLRRRGQIQSLAAATGVPTVAFDSPRGTRDPTLGALESLLPKADTVLLLGKQLDFTLGFGRTPALDANAKIIHIDPEAEALDRTRRVLRNQDRLLLSAQAGVMAATDRIVESAVGRNKPASAWLDEVTAAVQVRPRERPRTASARLHPIEVFDAVRAVMARMTDPVLVLDGGEFAQWARACLSASRTITNGPGGAIGGAIPFAIAARLACPHSTIVAPLGDGTFGFHMAEFETAARHRLPFLAIVGNDTTWNAEREIQVREYGEARAHSCEMLPARYDQVAIALGGHGEHVTRAEELPVALERALASGKPACVNVMIERAGAPRLRRL